LDFAERFRVFVLVMLVGCGLLLFVPGAMEWLFPSFADLMTVLCYVGVFFSLIFLVCSIVCPEWMSEFASLRKDECEQEEADMVTCYQCSCWAFVWKRPWLRGDYIGKVIGRCRVCGSEFRVKAIYAVEQKPTSRGRRIMSVTRRWNSWACNSGLCGSTFQNLHLAKRAY
jgi:hypothetical protein